MSQNNMYRVGDFVYFESHPSAPFNVRRIEELNKNQNGIVEAKVVCYYRRRDISSSLVQLTDRQQNLYEDDNDSHNSGVNSAANNSPMPQPPEGESCNGVINHCDNSLTNGTNGNFTASLRSLCLPPFTSQLSDQQRHRMKHRELFLSRQVEVLPATYIRGKCTVTLLNDSESPLYYVNTNDAFFYTVVYDPVLKTLKTDHGEIGIGAKYQAEIPNLLTEPTDDAKNCSDLETLMWNPENILSTARIDEFCLIARSVGTLARAYDVYGALGASVRPYSLQLSASSASRDSTLFAALNLIHECNYDFDKAVCCLVPNMQPLLVRDEMEEWTVSESNLLEEALSKYGKDFSDIKSEFLPWKTQTSLVEYYYMWKTTDRYVNQRKLKAAEAEHKLKQVFIPTFSKPSPSILYPSSGNDNSGVCCFCQATFSVNPDTNCASKSENLWFVWGSTGDQKRMCSACWLYWKKYGGIRNMSSTYSKALNVNGNNGTCNISVSTSAPLPSTNTASNEVPMMMKCYVASCSATFSDRGILNMHMNVLHPGVLASASCVDDGKQPHHNIENAVITDHSKSGSGFYFACNANLKAARRSCAKHLVSRKLHLHSYVSNGGDKGTNSTTLMNRLSKAYASCLENKNCSVEKRLSSCYIIKRTALDAIVDVLHGKSAHSVSDIRRSTCSRSLDNVGNKHIPSTLWSSNNMDINSGLSMSALVNGNKDHNDDVISGNNVTAGRAMHKRLTRDDVISVDVASCHNATPKRRRLDVAEPEHFVMITTGALLDQRKQVTQQQLRKCARRPFSIVTRRTVRF